MPNNYDEYKEKQSAGTGTVSQKLEEICLELTGFEGCKTNPTPGSIFMSNVIKSRELTINEKQVLKIIFGDTFDTEKPRIIDGKFLLGHQQRTGMTPLGHAFMHPSVYQEDYMLRIDGTENKKVKNEDLRHLFIHEMFHIWQHQHGKFVLSAGTMLACGTLLSIGAEKLGADSAHNYLNPYIYDVRKNPKLSLYSLENQAEMVADYYYKVYNWKKWNDPKFIKPIRSANNFNSHFRKHCESLLKSAGLPVYTDAEAKTIYANLTKIGCIK